MYKSHYFRNYKSDKAKICEDIAATVSTLRGWSTVPQSKSIMADSRHVDVITVLGMVRFE